MGIVLGEFWGKSLLLLKMSYEVQVLCTSRQIKSRSSKSRSTCVLCLAAQPCPLFATPWTVARQAPLAMGILQVRILE